MPTNSAPTRWRRHTSFIPLLLLAVTLCLPGAVLADVGQVTAFLKIASGVNGGPSLSDDDNFGFSVAAIGDLNGAGAADLAVCAFHDDTGGADRGAAYMLFMNADGTA